MIWMLAIGWFLIGIVWVRFREQGWLIMITDKRNTHRTWLAIPALFVTWLLWPFCNRVSRFFFLLSIAR